MVGGKKSEKRPAGRPRIINEVLIDQMCREIAAGKSVAALCRESWTPDKQTFYSWLIKGRNKEDIIYQLFSDRYEEATVARTECHMDEVVALADGHYNPWPGKQDAVDNGEISTDRIRVMIDTRLKYSEKCNPLRYGRKTMLTDESGKNAPRLFIFAPGSDDAK